MNNRIKVAIGVVAVGLVSSTSWWWLRETKPAVATPPLVRDLAKPDASVAVEAMGDPAHIPKPAQVTTLPSVDAPLSDVIGELQQRAATGEAAAGCRLASEYAFCAQLQARQAELQLWLSDRRSALDLINDPEVRKGAADNIERELSFRDEQLAKVETHCKGVPIPGAPQLAQLWRTAALAGDPAAMRQYASGNAFRWGELLDLLPELATYRQEGERVALVAASRGDFDMLLALASAYSGHDLQVRSLLNQAVRPNRPMSLAMYRHIEATLVRNGDEDESITRDIRQRIKDLETDLDGTELARAEKRSADIALEWSPPVVRGVGELKAAGSLREVDRGWCGR